MVGSNLASGISDFPSRLSLLVTSGSVIPIIAPTILLYNQPYNTCLDVQRLYKVVEFFHSTDIKMCKGAKRNGLKTEEIVELSTECEGITVSMFYV